MQPTDPYVPESLNLPLNLRALLENLSDRLRSQLSDNGLGPIEQLVGEAPEPYQATIFEELVIEEIQLRKMRGAQPTLEEYLQRFPDRAELVERAWQRAQPAGSLSTVDHRADDSDAQDMELGTGRADDPAPTHFGDYKVLRPLGSGTFGSVYQAQHESTGAIVAIKALKAHWARDPDCGQAMRRQFAEEAKRMLQFDHPHVVKVIALDERTEPPYFVQQYIDGLTLENRLQAGRLTLEQILQFAIQIADGLAHIHSHECWHRDLKPANILLDGNQQVYLADFGLALDEAQRWSTRRGAAGTYPYMAPEQINGATHRLNARCDIWALGVILYEMLTGRRPFRSQTLQQLREDVTQRTPPTPRELNQAIPRELNRLCMQCLSKRDSDRPHAAADVRDDLANILQSLTQAGSPIRPAVAPPVNAEKSPTPDERASSDPPIEYPVPTLKRFTAEQAPLYLRLMPRGYATEEELPELITFWKTRILQRDPDQTFAVGIMVGVSGCGKSSMLEAGLVPALPESIIPILIEASETDTEVRILNKLRRALPDAEPDQKWSLVDWTFRIRSGKVLPPGKKVVLILDQFEQWLNAHGGESTNQLLDALHQCDGEHLQAIVCVREGFHATLMRFVEALSFKLDEERNYATAHRFTPDHARFILTQFGRGLKRVDDPPTSQQQAFIDATVDALAESDRGVVCVRLVVLALVMQDRPWAVEELSKLGGLDGIGSQFLVDCFEGRTASEQYRRYLPAAMRVLAELLPAQGLEIKDVRSYEQLLAASELDKRQFDDLLNILVRKLFLLTPVEQVAVVPPSSSVSSSLTPHASSLYYQLTHDFLVPSIRDWLSRKLRETKAGRAQLRLQEATAAWTSKPENRNLPSMWEWFQIRRLTEPAKWKAGEKVLMQRATQYHLQRMAMSTAAVALLACGGWFAWHEVARQKEATRIAGLVDTLTNAEPSQIPGIVKQLNANPQIAQVAEEYLAPRLATEAKTPDEQTARLHARLASVARDPSLVDPLVEELLTGKESYVLPIRQLLRPSAAKVSESLQSLLQDDKADPKRRFRAALALADYVPPSDEATWTESHRAFVAKELVSSNAEFQPILREALRPIQDKLLSDLERIFGDSAASEAQRLSAANALADYAANDIGRLTQLLTVATPEQHAVLYPLVSAVPSPETIAQLSEVAATPPPEELGSVPRIAYGQRRANAAVTMLKLGEKEKVLPVFDWTDDPEAMTQFIVRCKPRGITIDTLLDLLAIPTLSIPHQPQGASPRFPPDQPQGASPRFPPDQPQGASPRFSTARYALLLALGEYAPSDIPPARRDALVQQLADWYAGDPSSGVHGASGWLLRYLGEKEIADRIDQTPVAYSPDREWFTLAITVQPNKEEGALSFLQRKPKAKTFYYTFIVFPRGEYWIGSVADGVERYENPLNRELRHPVRLTRSFAILDREVTYEEMIAFKPIPYAGMASEERTPASNPCYYVDWYDSIGFCRWLSKEKGLPESEQCYADPDSLDKKKYSREPNPDANWAPRDWPLNLNGNGFRLPTEAEWEVASRGGARTSYGFGSDVSMLGRFGWFVENSDKRSHAGRELRPSVRGLFDMHGNLFEWTHDWYSDFGESLQTDPVGAKTGSHRVFRGGSWGVDAAVCRSAFRYIDTPTNRSTSLGFRLALVPSGSAGLGPAEPGAGSGTGAEGDRRREE